MRPGRIVGTKRFGWIDQRWFAHLSGDINPMHMDPVAARRTLAGTPAVHGAHTMLWCLEMLLAEVAAPVALTRIRAKFESFVHVDDIVQIALIERAISRLVAEARVEGVVAMRLVAEFGDRQPATPSPTGVSGTPQTLSLAAPRDLALSEMVGQTGRLPFARPPHEVAGCFPACAAALGPQRLAALTCLSYLVGMACPGLHSIFAGFVVDLHPDAGPAQAIDFEVSAADERFRLVTMRVCGGGLTGSVSSLARTPPTEQPSIAALAGQIGRRDFSSSIALIIGGSRGLGEVAAKAIAAGGGRVILTYAIGRQDAERVTREVRDWGGICDMVQCDVTRDLDPQIGEALHLATHVYFFATPLISRRKSGMFSAPLFQEFCGVYVSAFYRLCLAIQDARPQGASIFYPSTVFVEERPNNLTEYAMAKAAGEILCVDLGTIVPALRIVVRRLQRVATDQTAGILPVSMADLEQSVLAAVRQMHEPLSASTRGYEG